MTKLLFGCGYLGSRVGRLWLQAGDDVVAVTRSPQRAEALAAQGYRTEVADVTVPESLRGLPEADCVLVAIGYDPTAGQSIEAVYAGGLRAILDALPSQTGRVVYISSTGVYAQNDGGWVDETSPCLPQRAGGKAALAAEQVLAVHPRGAGGVVLRLAGIYGPGRIPQLEPLRRGEPVAASEDGYLNLIHVEDAAAVVVAAAAKPTVAPLYCVSDGQPVRRGEFYRYLAELIHAPSPTFRAPAADAPDARRSATSKRVRNDRMRAELLERCAFPSYREGLADACESA